MGTKSLQQVEFDGNIEKFLASSPMKYHWFKRAVLGSNQALSMLPKWVRVGVRKARIEINAREKKSI